MDEQFLSLLIEIHERLASVAEVLRATPAEAIDPNRAYSRIQAARLLGVSVWTIDAARKEGLLREAQRLGQRDVRLTGQSLVRYQHERQAKGSTKVQKI